MTAKQQQADKMIEQIILVYQENKPAFAAVPALADGMEGLIDIEQEIAAVTTHQLVDITGTTKSKAETKGELASLTCQVAAGIWAWATDTNNTATLQQAKLTVPMVQRLNDKLIAPTCRNILQLATANLVALQPYGINNAIVQQLQQSIDGYELLSAQPRKHIIDRSGDTKKLVELFDAADNLLKNRADKLILGLQNTATGTYNAYQAARAMPHAAAPVKTVTAPTS